jgi:hypothetical protein
MRRILIAAAVWLFECAGALAQQTGPIYCGQQATQSAVTTKATVVSGPAAGSGRTYICGYTVSAVAASVITFQTGTGGNCATGSTATGPTIQLAATSSFTDSSPAFRGWLVPPNGGDLCATATSTASVTVYYAQQ